MFSLKNLQNMRVPKVICIIMDTEFCRLKTLGIFSGIQMFEKVFLSISVPRMSTNGCMIYVDKCESSVNRYVWENQRLAVSKHFFHLHLHSSLTSPRVLRVGYFLPLASLLLSYLCSCHCSRLDRLSPSPCNQSIYHL